MLVLEEHMRHPAGVLTAKGCHRRIRRPWMTFCIYLLVLSGSFARYQSTGALESIVAGGSRLLMTVGDTRYLKWRNSHKGFEERPSILAGRINESNPQNKTTEGILSQLRAGTGVRMRQKRTPLRSLVVETSALSARRRRWSEVGLMFNRCLRSAARGGLPGAAAGVLQVVTLMWLRTVVNYQCRYGTSMFAAAAELYRQGGVLRFYRGVSFAVVANPLSRFGMAAANEGALALCDALPWHFPVAVSTWIASVFAGMWRIMLTPLDTCKTVLQVEGSNGFSQLMRKVSSGNVACLYQGAFAASAATAVGYFPWFLTFNFLNQRLSVPPTLARKLMRNAGIGLGASFASDVCSNPIRVMKTTKQAAAAYQTELTYREAVAMVLEVDGWAGLLGRGLGTRIVANGLQSMLFTVVWRYLHEKYVAPAKRETDGARAGSGAGGSAPSGSGDGTGLPGAGRGGAVDHRIVRGGYASAEEGGLSFTTWHHPTPALRHHANALKSFFREQLAHREAVNDTRARMR